MAKVIEPKRRLRSRAEIDEMSKIKWLNRRPVEGGLGLGNVLSKEEIEENKRSPIALLFLFFLIGAAIATPAIILTGDTAIPSTTNPPLTPVDPIPTEPIEPIEEENPSTNLEDYSFNLDGWQPNTENNRYYLLNRPDDATKDDFQKNTLAVPSSKRGGGKREELQTSENQNITSEYFSYSLDLDKKASCEVELRRELFRRSELPTDDAQKITVPNGYSLDKLFGRLKDTYCTYFKSSRNKLIDEIKNPYVKNPDKDIKTTDGSKSLVDNADSPYVYRGAWYEHDQSLMGKYGQDSYLAASDYPNKYRSRFKEGVPGVDLSTVADDRLDSGSPTSSGVLVDDREAFSLDFFYRHFVSAPYGNVNELYRDKLTRKLNRPGNKMYKRTLTNPGTGTKRSNAWGHRYYKNYEGDVGFSSNSASEIVKTYDSNSIQNSDSILVVPYDYPKNSSFHTLWNGALEKSDIATNFFYAIQSTKVGAQENLNIQGETSPTDFGTYVLRASFDNSRNRSLNNNFSSWSEDTSVNSRYTAFDAATHGKRAGLGRFSYESTTLKNQDHRIFAENMYETSLSTECSNTQPGSIALEACPTTKVNVRDVNSVQHSVYVPENDNTGTRYYAELLEINELWDFLMKELEVIMGADKYKDLSFETSRNLFTGLAGDSQSFNEKLTLFTKYALGESLALRFKSHNFKIFEALNDLMTSDVVIDKFSLKTSNQLVSDQSVQLLKNVWGTLTPILEIISKKADVQLLFDDFSSLFNSFSTSLVNLVDFYAETEASRKLAATYTIDITNKDGNTFKAPILGSRLPYLHYVRAMKIAEAKRKFGEEEFVIYKWTKTPTFLTPLSQFKQQHAGEDRTVKLADATNGEAAYYVIHHLKDSQFPWIPLDYRNVNRLYANLDGAEDIYMGEYDTKFDVYIQEAENYVNFFMNNYYIEREGVTNRIVNYQDDPGGAGQRWVDFDVAKTDTKEGQRMISEYQESTAYSDGKGVASNLFTEYDHTQKTLQDFMFYSQASFMKRETVKTHCITTYKKTEEQKQDPGYGYVDLPTIENGDVNSLLSYVHVPKLGTEQEMGGLTHFKTDLARNVVWQSTNENYVDSNGKTRERIAYKVRSTTSFRDEHVSKLIHIFFSECISDEQYNKPLEKTDAKFETKNDEWDKFTKKYSLKIRWDDLDLETTT